MSTTGPDRTRWTDRHTFALFAVLYAGACLLGRATVLPGDGSHLVWPAAGIAVLWLLQAPRFGPVLVAVAVETVVVLLLTMVPPIEAVATALAAVAQSAIVVVLVRRWVPGALGTGGTGSIHALPTLLLGTLSVALGCIVGALVGCVGILLDTGSATGVEVAVWFGQQFCGLMVVASVGHLAWEHLTQPHTRAEQREVELGALWVVSMVGYGLVFSQDAPVSFLVLPLSVWCALRFSTFTAGVHAATFGAVSVVATILGLGPFSVVDEPDVAAIVTQGFTLVVLLTALVVGSVRDQREDVVRQLLRSEAMVGTRADLLSAMTQAMTEGLVLVDSSGTLVQVNDAARRLLDGTSARGATRTSAYELLRLDGSPLPPAEQPSRRAMAEGEVPPTDVVVPLEDGTRRILSVRASRLPSGVDPGSGPMALLVFTDVTDERAESRRLAEFAEVAAHDLRSPLTTVRGWASLASSELDGDPPSIPLAKDLIAKSLSGVARMTDLVDAMLERASAEGAELRFETLELTTLVEEASSLLGVPDVTVHTDASHTVLADEHAVHQVFANLLGNAVKYADPARPLAVDVHLRRRESRVLVDVTDNGRGIPEDEQEAVFDRFRRSTSATAVAGTGIGLALCRIVVERHGGTMVCTTGPGGIGTTFSFDLPAAEDGEPPVPP